MQRERIINIILVKLKNGKNNITHYDVFSAENVTIIYSKCCKISVLDNIGHSTYCEKYYVYSIIGVNVFL